MSVALQCPQCGRGYKVKKELANKRLKCKCGRKMAAAASGLLNLLDEELNFEVDPKLITDPHEWAKASGNAELAGELETRMQASLSENQTFLVTLVCGIAALLFLVGVVAIMLAGA